MCPVMAPPFSRVEPVTEILHGLSVTDPYRWLEDQNSAETRVWLEDQTRYARAYLDSIPERKKIRARVANMLAVPSVSTPWKVRDHCFYLKREANEQNARIVTRGGQEKETTLVTSNQEETAPSAAVGILSISPDAHLLAYSVKDGGEDSCRVRFVDVFTRRLLDDTLPRGFCRGLVFSPNHRGFYYSHESCQASDSQLRTVRWHEFGGDAQDRVVFAAGYDRKLRVILVSSPSNRRLGYYKLTLSDPRTNDFLIHEPCFGRAPHVIVEQMEGFFVPYLLEDCILALTDWRAPNRRVVRIDPANPGRSHWKTVVPERSSRLQELVVTRDLIVAAYGGPHSTCLETFDLWGNGMGQVPLTCEGTASLFPCHVDTDTVFYGFSSIAHAPSIYCFNVATRKTKSWFQTPTAIDPSLLEIARVSYPSTDGTRIPMMLVSRRHRKRTGPQPAFLTAYGGFGKNVTPQYAVYSSYLAEQGCLFALANLRGGAEFGEAWHLAAKRLNRQVAVDDFHAAAEWLVRSSHVQGGRLAIGGGSNAGLLVGAALTQRPELFRAVICLGPLLDMLRYHLFDSASKWINEYGSAELETDFPALLRYSPYHRVQDGVSYPAVMFISGDRDTRCNPMHARKMVARLQAATRARPILLDHRHTWGHMPVQPLDTRIEALTDRLAFLSYELGLDL